jgi:hypothetical protein
MKSDRYDSSHTQTSHRGKRMTTNPHIGSSLDDLLEEDGVLDEVEAIAKKRVLACLVSQLACQNENSPQTEKPTNNE